MRREGDEIETHTQTSATLEPVPFLKRYGPVLARTIAGPQAPPARQMDVKVLKSGPDALTLTVALGGEKHVVKHFSERPDGARAYQHERDALREFSSTGLVPKLLQYSDAPRILISSHVAAPTARSVVAPDKLAQQCRDIGRWLGAFCAASPSQPAEGDWGAYLARYVAVRDAGVLKDARDFLASFPLRRFVLAKNDGALTNLLMCPDGLVFGVDFEKAARKPQGWDLLLTVRAMVRLLPRHADDVAGWMADGFAEAGPGQAKEWAALARIFVIACAFQTSARRDVEANTVRAAVTKATGTPAPFAVLAPFQPAGLSTPDPARVLVLRSHIDQVAAEVWADPRTAEEKIATDRAAGDTLPSAEHAAICSTCQGACCTPGADHNAFIDTATIAHLRCQMPDLGQADVTAYYLDRIGAQTVTDSCLFHGAQGCTLPRIARSRTCNNFQCRAAQTFLDRARLYGAQGGAILAGDQDGVHRAAQIDGDRTVDFDPKGLGGLADRSVGVGAGSRGTSTR